MMSEGPPAPSYNGAIRDVGYVGEEAFERFCRRQQWVEDVRDVRDDIICQRDEIDFIITKWGGITARVEVKTETKLDVSGNILVELTRINHSGEHQYMLPGWPWRTVSDYIVYYAPATERLHWWTKRDYLAGAYEWVRSRGKNLRTLITETSTERIVISTVVAMNPYMTMRPSYRVVHKDEEVQDEQRHQRSIDADEDQSIGGAAYH